uniref:Mono-ADP ribosylhydrolase 2 n=1 Tax=Coturnix japonica TaxID=93934 RepID=A0A8C2TIJ5_COTJA
MILGKDVIHTVGPIARGHVTDTHEENLASCYKTSLKLAKENSIRSLAFPCISTGIYGFPNEPAADIALKTTKEWLNKNHNEVDRIIFCVFLEVDYKIFKKRMGEVFPIDDNEETEISEETGLDQKGQPLSPTKCKAEQAEDLQDDAEDETKPSALASLSSSEEAKPSEDKDSLKDSKATRESDPAHPMGCEQDQAQGQQEAAVEEEMKTGADSQSSCMEIEELLLNQEDTTEDEKPLIPSMEEKEKEGGGVQEEEKGMQEQEETSAEPMKVDVACESAEASRNDGLLFLHFHCHSAQITCLPKVCLYAPLPSPNKSSIEFCLLSLQLRLLTTSTVPCGQECQ